MLGKRGVRQLQRKYHFHPDYINSMMNLSILQRKLKKTKVRERDHYKHIVYDFKPGYRIIYRKTNYVVDIATVLKKIKLLHITKLIYLKKLLITK